MYLKPATMEDINKIYQETKLQKVLEQFAESSVTVMEVAWDKGEYTRTGNLSYGLNAAIQRSRRAMKAISKGGRVFLIKTDGGECLNIYPRQEVEAAK